MLVRRMPPMERVRSGLSQTFKLCSGVFVSDRCSCFILPCGFDFDFVRRGEELSTQAEGLSLKNAIDEINSLLGLLLVASLGDLIGVKLQGQPVDGDGFHWSFFEQLEFPGRKHRFVRFRPAPRKAPGAMRDQTLPTWNPVGWFRG